MDIVGIILWGIGILVAVVLAVWGTRKVSTKKTSQNQNVSGGSTGIQSGRDTKIKNDK